MNENTSNLNVLEYEPEPFTMVQNSIINRADISSTAKMVLIYLLSKPRGWNVNTRDILKHMMEREFALKAAIRMLKDKGYLAVTPVRDPKGKITYWKWSIDKNPQRTNEVEKKSKIDMINRPQGGNQLVGDQLVVNRPISNTEYSNTEDIHMSASAPPALTKKKAWTKEQSVRAFDELWKQYPDPEGRSKAMRAFMDTVNVDNYDDICEALKRYLNSKRVKNGFIKPGCNWFKEWHDWVHYEQRSVDKINQMGEAQAQREIKEAELRSFEKWQAKILAKTD